MNGLSALIWVTCSWIASHFASSGAPETSTQVVINSSGTSIFAANASISAICSGVASSGGAQNGFMPELLHACASIRSRTDARDRLLVELRRRPRLETRVLELLRIPGRVARPLERADRDVVGPDVVGVAVAAELVVGRDDVGLVAADQPGQPAGGLVEVGLPERARVAVAVGAHHPGVAIAEVLPLGDAEDAHRPLELAGPDLAEAAVVVGRVHVRDDDLAELAAGAGHEDHAVAGLDRLGHRAAGPDRLVVGMGVDGHQGRAVARGVCRHGSRC